MDEASLVRKFMDADMQLTKDAFDLLRKQENMESVVEHVFSCLEKMEKKPFLITADLIAKILEGDTEIVSPPPSIRLGAGKGEPVQKPPESVHTRFKPKAADFEPRVKVLKDVTGRSYAEGSIKDFITMFRDRYKRLSGILKKRADLHDAIPIGNLGDLEDGSLAKVVGIVSEKRETPKGHVVLEIEDLSGRALAWVFKGRRELMQKAAEVVVDEVLGIMGEVRSRDRFPELLVREIVWPDLPISHEPPPVEDPVCAVLISDLHVGSEMFLEDLFLKFVRWLRGESGNEGQRDLASRVKYLVLAGDVVDGIGVYPQQEEELLIDDVFEQYDIATDFLAQIPEHITLIIAPGNHDAIRAPEPQPALPKDMASRIYDLNSVMVGNPALVSLHDVKFLIYHGRSFDDLVTSVPGLSRRDPIPMMAKLLQKRHLAPIYGERTAISPEQSDYLVIDEAPDVFQCGHVHVHGCGRYRGVELINSGTFQGTTIYMRRLGVKPTPGLVPVVDLQTRQTRVMRFV